MDALKPVELYGREREWAVLREFVDDPRDTVSLGLMYGRRRQGKTLMLELLAEATGGFMFTGLQQSSMQNLTALSEAYARHIGLPSFRFDGWSEAISALLALGESSETPTPVVLDEFSYLLEVEPGLASMIQIEMSPLRRKRQAGRTRLVLCGSAVSVMRNVLSGTAPLRGRASMELLVQPFGFRDAAAFWNVDSNVDLAFRLHALMGGTPAYRNMTRDAPSSGVEFDRWVVHRLLDPASAMFREGNLLLHEEPALTDTTLYQSVLTAIGHGATRRGEIASLLGRSDSALAHPLAMLEHVLLIARMEDAFRRQRASYRIAEPVVRFNQLVIRPQEARLVAGAAERVWSEESTTVSSQIYGPHLEDLAREWCLTLAEDTTVGGMPSRVQPAVLACRSCRHSHQLDVVVTATAVSQPTAPDRVTAIGEVKATGTPLDVDAALRLDHIRAVIPADRVDRPPKRLLFSRSGFTRQLRSYAEANPDVELVDLQRLYTGG